MGAVAVFDYTQWVTMFPEFQAVDSDLAFSYWTRATLIHDNSGGGPVQDVPTQQMLMNLMTTHIAYISKPEREIVGRVDSASEGSVNVSATFDVPPGVPQYFTQSKWGVEYWVATAPFRTMRYRRQRTRNFEPLFGGGRGRFW